VNNIRIDKIKIDRKTKGVTVIYSTPSPAGGYDDIELKTTDKAQDSFYNAMKVLGHKVAEICDYLRYVEEDRKYQIINNFDVFGVTFSYSEEGKGVTISSIKKLVGFDVPLCINTPHIKEDDWGSELRALLVNLKDEAINFIQGKRAQMTIFDAVNTETTLRAEMVQHFESAELVEAE
jgi:hypothetical protein